LELRWGFIGAGDVTRVKGSPAAFTHVNSRVVAVVRRDLDRARQYAAEHGIPKAHASVDDLLADPEVNAVYISTPPQLHCEQTIQAARAGKHVLCEKPLAPSVADCTRMVDACRLAGVLFAVAYYRRFYPLVEKMREIVEGGTLGRLTSALVVNHGFFNARLEDGSVPWRAVRATSGGGVLTDVGSHRIDLLLYLLGGAAEVSAQVDTLGAQLEVEDKATALIRFQNRAIATVDESWCSRARQDHFEIGGVEGRVVAPDLEGDRLMLQHGKNVEWIEVERPPRGTHAPAVRDFARALNEGGSVRCSGEDGARATQIIELACRAAREGRTIEVPGLY
jgi:predicted dehydrogenase